MVEGEQFIKPIGGEKKKNWNKILVIIIISFLVTWAVAIAIGDKYSFSGQEKKPKNLIQIGGHDFYILEDYTFGTFLIAGNNKVPIAFRLDPRQAGNISLNSAAVQKILTAPKIYIAFNPNEKNLGKIAIASAEISRITSLYNIPTVGAYTRDSKPVDLNVPIRTCDNAENNIVVTLEISDRTEVSAGGNCINVKGKNADELILAADKLGMNLVGIRL